MMTDPSIYALVVTYNRRPLLEQCLRAIAGQSRQPARILVVDNASTDDTQSWAQASGLFQDGLFRYIRMQENTGGAGGFAEGMRQAIEMGAEWIWMMDDDALPHADALERLWDVVTINADVYGSLAVNGGETAWATTVLDQGGRVVNEASQIPELARVKSIPFLGFLIHRDLVARIGLPDTGYFIAADDVEYCLRAERAGARILIAGKSRIEHPKASSYVARLPWGQMLFLHLPPWKRYYDTRNRLLIARSYYGYRFWTQTLPGSFVRLAAALIHEPGRIAQMRAFLAGLYDGLAGIKGKRHLFWRIGQ